VEVVFRSDQILCQFLKATTTYSGFATSIRGKCATFCVFACFLLFQSLIVQSVRSFFVFYEPLPDFKRSSISRLCAPLQKTNPDNRAGIMKPIKTREKYKGINSYYLFEVCAFWKKHDSRSS